MLDLDMKWVQFGTFFLEQISVLSNQYVLKTILVSPRFLPFGTNLTQFVIKPDIPEIQRSGGHIESDISNIVSKLVRKYRYLKKNKKHNKKHNKTHKKYLIPRGGE